MVIFSDIIYLQNGKLKVNFDDPQIKLQITHQVQQLKDQFNRRQNLFLLLAKSFKSVED